MINHLHHSRVRVGVGQLCTSRVVKGDLRGGYSTSMVTVHRLTVTNWVRPGNNKVLGEISETYK